jgi:hypothetical protein
VFVCICSGALSSEVIALAHRAVSLNSYEPGKLFIWCECGRVLISEDKDDGGGKLSSNWLGRLEDTDLENGIRGR